MFPIRYIVDWYTRNSSVYEISHETPRLACFAYPSCNFNALGGGVPLGRSSWKFAWSSPDTYCTKSCKNIAEKFNRLSRVHQRHRRQTSKHRIPFPSIQHLAWLPQGRPQGKQKCGENSDFIGLTHWLKHRITRKLYWR